MPVQSREFSDLSDALRGQYALERELGRGGMGVVFLARDLKLDRRVAIKTLPTHLADEERVRERFLREARTAAGLSHQNIVPIHRADEIGGQVFFVMGFVDGDSLAQRVTERGPMPPDEAVRLLRDVALALHEAHRHGIVHRDVKAENILLDGATGRAMVTDFGIARLAEAAPLTATGLLLGTVYYMSPEHVAGETVDARSDVYSLGVVAFYALTGRFPFENESASAVLVAHVTKAAPKVREVAPEIPAVLAEIVDRCLAKEPSLRFQSALELAAALGNAAGEVAAAPPPVRRARPAAAERDASLISNTEAQAVWERAARLQAHATGTVAPVVRPRDETSRVPLSASSAYRLDVVRESAREAGIATEYVDRALAERGLAERAGDPVRPRLQVRADDGERPVGVVRDVRRKPVSRWAGAPTSLEYEVIVEGEVAERDFDQLIETIRRTLGEVGMVSAVGRSLAWSSTADAKRKLNVGVHVRGGRTTIRVTEHLGNLAGGVFGGGVGGFGGGFGGPMFGIMMDTVANPLIALGAAVTWVATVYGGARQVYKRMVRTRQQKLIDLVERLAEEARAIIAERSDEMPRPRGSRR